MDPTTLLRSVEEEFERTSRGLAQWDDPHPPPERLVADGEYSRVTDPAKWRIVGARVDAWLDVLAAAGLATVGRDAQVEWEEPPSRCSTTNCISGRPLGSTSAPFWPTRVVGASGQGRPGSVDRSPERACRHGISLTACQPSSGSTARPCATSS